VSGAAHDPRIAAALAQLDTILVPGETVDAVAVQRRIFALVHRRTLVAATSSRLIGLTRHLLGGFSPVDVQWQDVRDARLTVGMLGARLAVHLDPSGQLAFEGLAKDDAQKVYRLCQAQEQSWREKRRIRDLEELRAKSGGVHLGSGLAGTRDAATTVDSEGDSVTRLERARVMLEKGLISDSEFETIRAKIINSL
jgi:hypothetical protein